MKTIFPSLCAIAAIAAGLGVTAAQASPALSDVAGVQGLSSCPKGGLG
jgi:hypothetical protein